MLPPCSKTRFPSVSCRALNAQCVGQIRAQQLDAGCIHTNVFSAPSATLGDVIVRGNATFLGSVTGIAFDFPSGLAISADAPTVFAGDVEVQGQLAVPLGDLTVSGVSTLTGGVRTASLSTGSFASSGTGVFAGVNIFSGSLVVGGPSSFDGGARTASLTASGAVAIQGQLSVSGQASLLGGLVTSSLTAADATLGSLAVSGPLIVAGLGVTPAAVSITSTQTTAPLLPSGSLIRLDGANLFTTLPIPAFSGYALNIWNRQASNQIIAASTGSTISSGSIASTTWELTPYMRAQLSFDGASWCVMSSLDAPQVYIATGAGGVPAWLPSASTVVMRGESAFATTLPAAPENSFGFELTVENTSTVAQLIDCSAGNNLVNVNGVSGPGCYIYAKCSLTFSLIGTDWVVTSSNSLSAMISASGDLTIPQDFPASGTICITTYNSLFTMPTGMPAGYSLRILNATVGQCKIRTLTGTIVSFSGTPLASITITPGSYARWLYDGMNWLMAEGRGVTTVGFTILEVSDVISNDMPSGSLWVVQASGATADVSLQLPRSVPTGYTITVYNQSVYSCIISAPPYKIEYQGGASLSYRQAPKTSNTYCFNLPAAYWLVTAA